MLGKAHKQARAPAGSSLGQVKQLPTCSPPPAHLLRAQAVRILGHQLLPTGAQILHKVLGLKGTGAQVFFRAEPEGFLGARRDLGLEGRGQDRGSLGHYCM